MVTRKEPDYGDVNQAASFETTDSLKSIHDPTATEPEDGRITFNPKPAWYRVGDNEVLVRLAEVWNDAADPPQVLSLEVDVRYMIR